MVMTEQNKLDQAEFLIPTCPHCESDLTFDGIHLMCENTKCVGRIAKQLTSNVGFLNLKGIGPKTISPFATDFEDLIDVICWARTVGHGEDIKKYGIKPNTRSHEKFINTFNNIKSMSFGEAIVLLSYNNVGLKLAELIAKMYNTGDADFTGHDKSIIEMFQTQEVTERVKSKLDMLLSVGISIEEPKEKEITDDTLFICMTGKPKAFGFASKKVFMAQFGDRLIEVSLSHKDCNYLIVDDINSTTKKTKDALKKNIKIITYGDFVTNYS